VSDALFVTLDPLVRRVRAADHRELLVSDTVGFINRLPHALVAAFRATLEAVAEADLLLHVVDAASPGADGRMAAVRGVLEEVHAADVPLLDVMNKCDRLEEPERRRIQQGWPDAWLVSAATGDGCGELLDAIAARLGLDTCRVTLEFDPECEADRARIGQLYRHAKVIGHVARHDLVSIEADVPRRLLSRFTHEGNGVR
jgi:GTP-binding protein HflX